MASNMMKKNVFILILLGMMGSGLFAEQITRIAVLDMNKVMSVYYDNSRNVQDVEKKKKEYQQEILKMNDEIIALEAKKKEAKDKGDDNRALDLDKQIFQKKEYMKDYIRVKENQLNQMMNKTSQQLSLADDIVKSIKFVAESNGFSLVINSSDTDLIWWNFEVDITDLVVQDLQRRKK